MKTRPPPKIFQGMQSVPELQNPWLGKTALKEIIQDISSVKDPMMQEAQ